ncbi:putative peptidoglycan binding protein [Tepidamorphus gemmatus]|uniref:Putative peptidoglycan binding protein n=2 Tax=Tepidamorphus gemmatus TaxID=747076 RepID=A0A4R3MH74_9HYPH|nr:putative peptidoglycan binding protein [Tepidamorphus gemmatus]
MPPRHCMLSSIRSLAAGVMLFGLSAATPDGNASAQSGILAPGDGVVTQFSGLRREAGNTPLPDPDGVTVRAFGLTAPGFAANGSVWDNAPQTFALTAGTIGQVFGVAFDDAEPANAYLAATSAFGLYLDPAGRDWAPGMWGEGGGPGTLWKLDAANGYRPVPFAEIGDANGNGGAALGGVTFDPWNRQLFVSDLESGLIHRVDLASGETVQVFDHGLDGRSYFLDVPSGQYLVLDVVPQDIEAAPRFDNCVDADGNAAAFSRTPDCWNYADFRRRVWGLGIQRDPITDTVRLYYAVWGGAGFGNPEWDTAGDDARTSVWSIRLDGNGGFDLTDVRREFIVPPIEDIGEAAAQVESPAITQIAFSSDGGMVIAERARPAPVFTASEARLVRPGGARVLHFVRGEDGVWEPDGRYDVGFPERGADAPPFIRANASGGVAYGHGFTEEGAIDPDAPDGTVWMSGDPLCDVTAPCIDRATGRASIEGPIGGLQGTPAAAMVDLVAPVTIQPYPAAGGPVTPPEGPLSSYIVPAAGSGPLVGAMGSLAIYRGEPPIQTVELPSDEGSAVDLPPEARQNLPAPLPDLAVAKTGFGTCRPGGDCIYEISVTNRGPVDFLGPILLTDTIGAPGVSFTSAGPEPWICYPADGNVYCQHPTTTLQPGQQLTFSIALRPGPNHREPRLNNCAAVTWLGRQGRDRIRAVQAELKKRGFNPGTVDGLMGPNTAAAIRAAESALGLPTTGNIGPGLVETLFGQNANQDGDASAANDQDCALVPVDVPPPPAHLVQISTYHRKFDSVSHDPRTSGPIVYHDPEISYFHRTWQSSLHDSVLSQPVPLHRVALSQFHLTWGSAYHDSVYTQLLPVHSPGLSGFHSSYRSVLHDYRTSSLLPSHRYDFSRFHRTWSSSRHDGYVTRLAPAHWVQLSAFHRRFNSSSHDGAVTRMRPVHTPAVSSFHSRYTSDVHDRLTTRHRPIHSPALSRFHDRSPSSIHDLTTTRSQPIHRDNISYFHRSFTSGQHDPLTTRMRPIHEPSLSDFHRTYASGAHDARRSNPIGIHTVQISSFHRTGQSAMHNPGTSTARPVHDPGVTSFHRTGASGLHDPNTSRASPVHAPQVSNFHGRNQSGMHNRGTSDAQPPSHQLSISNFHRNGESSLHDPANSQARPPVHQPAVSNFHRQSRSGQHNAQTSQGIITQPRPPVSPGQPGTPAHNQVVSAGGGQAPGIPRPGTPAHDAGISAGATQPSHKPAASRATTVPSPGQPSPGQPSPGLPAHNPTASRATTVPSHSAQQSRATTPQPPAHNETVSRGAATPGTPQQPVHSQAASRAITTPPRPAHSQSASRATTQPRPPQTPPQPAHSQAASRAATTPPQPAHSQSSSRAATQPRPPQTPPQPAHNQAASRAATMPQQPAHSPNLSRAAIQPRPPQQPAHTPNVSAAQQRPPAVQAPRTPAQPPQQQQRPPAQAHNPQISQAQRLLQMQQQQQQRGQQNERN